MKHIEKIKSGTLKDYMGPGLIGGFIVGLLFFIITGMSTSWPDALATGFAIWFLFFILHIAGFYHTEWWKRKKKIETLQSEVYSSLINSGYELDNDLFFKKEIDGFQTEIHIDDKNNHYLKVYCNYRPQTIEQLQNGLKNLIGVEKTGWDYGFVLFQIPDGIINYNSFNQNAVKFLIKNSVEGLTKTQWQETIGNELEKQMEERKRTNTKTLKIGKLKIDYIKDPQKPVANKE